LPVGLNRICSGQTATEYIEAAMSKTPITVARGDGIGPEIMDATLRILEAGGAKLDIEFIEVGEQVYKAGHNSGIKPESWETLRSTGLLLKGPITTPQGGGWNSLNVTIRKSMGLFANVRPVRAYSPFIDTRHPNMDVVIVRENEEDLYAGIEHRQTDEVVQCLKLISRPGSERIIRFAFETTMGRRRRKLSCMTKDNIMKLTDGLFHAVFNEIAEEYPDIETDHYIIDIGMARVAAQPERFDVVVLPNLYGDIVSDVAAEVCGSVGMAGSANIGEKFAMFEAIHGSAPDIAGQGVANPSGLLNGALMMLAHIGQGEAATRIGNAWLCTIEDGIHTSDIFRPERSTTRANTKQFADAVIERIGKTPTELAPAAYPAKPVRMHPVERRKPARKELVGVDVFLDWTAGTPDQLAEKLKQADTDTLKLKYISNRGVKVWPDGFPETFCSDHWRCRFKADGVMDNTAVVELLGKVQGLGLDFIKTEHLYNFDGKSGYSKGQGE
jgi:isocitrate dehydrogenase